MPSHSDRVAIVGASSLLGKELKRILEDRNFPSSEIVLLDTNEAAGTLTEAAGEPTFIRSLEEDSFEHSRYAFFAGTPADAVQNIPAALRSGATVIDLSGAAVGATGAVISIPSLSTVLLPVPTKPALSGAVYFSPPAAVLIACTVSAAISKFSPLRLALTLFPPVSEYGQGGIDELESQTAGLLSFRSFSQATFDCQVAFNLLDRLGESATPGLDDTRRKITAFVSQFLSGRAPLPAIQLIQSPVFYGYAFSAFAEFPSAVPLEQLHASFASLGARIAGPDDPAPSNVSVAGENEIHLAVARPDDLHPSSFWFWGAADNLRLPAGNAVRIAEELLAKQ
ncbi:MAG TPA: Asd/ArgC dimerization domain-containing protein [Verrucomicrobiae bacterium]|nr:Asd/ArgC dimerization domain-containing protein [Verrucomicrobiae bacterium]